MEYRIYSVGGYKNLLLFKMIDDWWLIGTFAYIVVISLFMITYIVIGVC